MITTETMTVFTPDDAELVAGTLSGDRNAFSKIVSRYQSLICSLAYSATGSLSQSEDLAQETFIAAWKHLRHLRERHKLKAWLCGIARNRINNCLRREGREPLREAEPLETLQEASAAEPLPHDHAISKEEETILWRSLERLPQTYREPLVLFYREHQSIENVAAALDLTEDAVKQRLSRGRKLLAEEVASFVEGALARTNPSKAFTLAVLASLPVLTTSAKAATLGAAAIKTGAATAKLAAGMGVVSTVVGSLLGFAGPWLQYRIALESAQSEEHRSHIRRYFRWMFAVMLFFGVALIGLVLFGRAVVGTRPGLFIGVLFGFLGIFALVGTCFAVWSKRIINGPGPAAGGEGFSLTPFWEYRSAASFLGLPLVHIRLGRPAPNWAPVKAWIAAGDCALGGLFAFGGLAVAPISVGGLAIGLMPWGGAALGLFVLGGIALGGWAFGGFAIGWQAFGGCAVGWQSAMGGLAVARDFALGGVAHAAQVNNLVAEQFIKGQPFFARMELVAHHIGWLNLLWLIPLVGWWRAIKRANRRAAQVQL